MDLPPEPPEEDRAVIYLRERPHWRNIEALSIFVTGLPEGIDMALPSPDANQLALSCIVVLLLLLWVVVVE